MNIQKNILNIALIFVLITLISSCSDGGSSNQNYLYDKIDELEGSRVLSNSETLGNKLTIYDEMLLAAINEQDFEKAKSFVDKGADISHIPYSQFVVLNPKFRRYLIDLGYNLKRDKNGDCLLEAALHFDSYYSEQPLEGLKPLINEGAPVDCISKNKYPRSTLYSILRKLGSGYHQSEDVSIEVLELIINNSNKLVNMPSFTRENKNKSCALYQTLLYLSIYNVLNKRSNPKPRFDPSTPSNIDESVLMKLLNAGADIKMPLAVWTCGNKKNIYETALSLAVNNYDIDFVRFLLNSGVDINQVFYSSVYNRKMTAIDLARANSYKEIELLLFENGGKYFNDIK